MMTMIEKMRASLAGVALALAATIGLAGPAAAQAVVPEARAALPEAMRQSGVLNVATALQWAPFAYKAESGEAVGIDISLVKLLAAKMGLQAKFDDLKFPSIVPGVQTGRYDVGANQIGITDERLKAVAMLPYFNTGYGLLVRKGAATVDVNNLCGKTMALTTGSAQTAIVESLSAKCVQAGKPEIGKVFYPSSADSYLAVANGRGDGFVTARAVAVYISRINPRLDVAPGSLDGLESISGLAVGKENHALYQAMLIAMESAVADGSYAAILKEFGASESALTAERIKAGSGS